MEVQTIQIIDVHSQVSQDEDLDKIIQLMNQAGVACTILATRGTATQEELLSFASKYAGRIIPALRTKGREYITNDKDGYYQFLKKWMNTGQYGAIGEVLMYHDQIVDKAPELEIVHKAPEIVVYPDDERAQAALDYALDKKWPFVIHIEFVAAESKSSEFKNKFMVGLEALLTQHPEHPFVLIHMGQLSHVAVRQLIEAHPNIHFITSHSNPITIKQDRYPGKPWTNMFDGNRLSADWKQLMVNYPDRFILGFDMVWAEDWGQFYLATVALWQETIKELPAEVAHVFAHGNAERLWHLPPVK